MFIAFCLLGWFVSEVSLSKQDLLRALGCCDFMKGKLLESSDCEGDGDTHEPEKRRLTVDDFFHFSGQEVFVTSLRACTKLAAGEKQQLYMSHRP